MRTERKAHRPRRGAPGRRLEVVGVSVLGGLVFWVAVRYPTLGPLLGLAWVILMAPAVVERWRSPLLGFAPGLAVAVSVLWWPLSGFGLHVFVLITALSTWHFLVQPLLANWLWRASRLPAVVVLPLSVGAGEWTRPLLGFGNFNMYQTGAFLHTSPPLIQAADLVGALGLSVLWTVPWAAGVDWLRWRVDHTGAAGRAAAIRGSAFAVLTIVALLGYGGYRLATERTLEGPTIAVLQPNVAHGIDKTEEAVREQRRLTHAHVPRGAADLIVWPENAILAPYERRPVYQAVVREITLARDAPLLFGSQSRRTTGFRQTNTAFVVDRSGRIVGRNDKMYLWPFSERRAFRALERRIPALERFLTRVTVKAWGDAPDGIPGVAPQPMTLTTERESWTFWAPICYETGYADIAREAARDGARFFVNITSEGWLGWGFCNNQMAVSALRAVENRVGLVRAGNAGISCFIRPDGRVERFLRGLETGRLLLEPGVLIHPVRVSLSGPTFYSRWGGAVDLTWPLGWLGLSGVFVTRRLLRRGRATASESSPDEPA